MKQNPCDVAVKDLGLTESPMGSNNVKFNTWYYGRKVYGNNFAWCMAAVQYWYNYAGYKIPYRTAYCPAFYSWAKNRGYLTSKPVRGDIVLYDWNGDGTYDHTGIVESWDGEKVTAIEGNTSSGNYGDQSNGGGVFRRTRKHRAVNMVFIHIFDFENDGDGDDDMTGEQIYKELSAYMKSQPLPKWAEKELQEAVDLRIKDLRLTDGSNPMGLMHRYEAMILAKRAYELGRKAK